MTLIKVDFLAIVRHLAVDLDIDSATVNYVLRRAECEGLRFLTVILPAFSKYVLASIEAGSICSPDLPKFTSIVRKGRLPLYFRGCLSRIFDVRTGDVLTDIDPVALWQLRQFCEYFYKLALSSDSRQIADASQVYVRTEQEIASYPLNERYTDDLRRCIETNYKLGGSVVTDVFKSARPRFGPGSFFESELCSVPYWKYKLLNSSVIGTARTDQLPFCGYFRDYPSSKEGIHLVPEGRTSQVLFVPKDGRGPRVISKEPLHLLRAQLAFFGWLSSHLERVTRRRINFVDQSINRSLAREGSLTGSWSTLDLKEASDRVSYNLCKKVFRHVPSIWYFITRWRATHTILPEKGLIPLKKLSGMGSGLTFPILALLVHASISRNITRRTGLSHEIVASSVYVYGDDVVVPTEWFDFAVEGLSHAGLLVNSAKSFTKSLFRESCGGDYYRGNDVTPVRLRLNNAGLGTPESYRNLVATAPKGRNWAFWLERHCRQLVKGALLSVSEYFYSQIERQLGPLPTVSGDAKALGRYTLLESLVGNTDKAYVPVPVIRRDDRVSPWKYLGSFLPRKLQGPLERLLTPRGTSFGEISVPRSFMINRKPVSYLDLI